MSATTGFGFSFTQQAGYPKLARFASVLAQSGAGVELVSVGRIGATSATTVALRCPLYSYDNLRAQVFDRCGELGFTPERRIAPETCSVLLTGEDSCGLVWRVCHGISEAGGNIAKFDFWASPGFNGVGQMTIDAEIAAPANVGIAQIVRQILRRTPNDELRVFDGATGHVLAVREATWHHRLPSMSQKSGDDREFVLTSNGPDQAGLLAKLGVYLTSNEASICRITSYSIGGRFVVLLLATCSDAAFGRISASYKKKLPGSVLSARCSWKPPTVAPAEVVYRLELHIFDDIQAVSPVWRLRKAAERNRVALGFLNPFPFRADWFGTKMYRIASIVRGTEEAAKSFAAEIERWVEKEGVGFDFDRSAPREFANERDIYQPFQGIETYSGESVFDLFR